MRNDLLRRVIQPGSTVALADGAGAPSAICAELSSAARDAGGVRLITGWLLETPPGLDFSAFAEVHTFMAGYGVAAGIREGTVRYTAATVSQLPALLAGRWCPDAVVVSARRSRRGLTFGSEVSWIAAAAAHARHLLVEINDALPDAARPGLLPSGDLKVVSETRRAPTILARAAQDEITKRIGAEIAELVRPGDVLQFGPGAIGEALVRAVEQPVAIDSGIITDAVVDLADRGLLIGEPLGTYLVGTPRVYEWADGRAVLDRIEITHDSRRLSDRDLIAVNTALEIDELGQVNIETAGGRRISGIGGHPDYAIAASRAAHGLSIIALPSVRRGRSTLVERLSAPVSTPRWAVDVVVTEWGRADMRGLSDDQRKTAIAKLFPSGTQAPARAP